MKLLQLNIWGGRLERQIADLVKQQNPDFICFQEAISIDGDAAFGISVEQLAEETGYKHLFMSPVFSFNLMNKTASFGNAILSKQPFTTSETLFTNLTHKTSFDFDTDDYNVRNLQHVIVEVNGKQLHILNHHGHHVREHKNGNDDTLRQMKQIADYIDTLSGPLLLAGDFNLAPDSVSLALINKRLINLPVAYGLATTRTQLTHKQEICDYIFINEAIKADDFRALEDLASDHQALVIEFDLI